MKCRVCGEEAEKSFSAKIINKYDIDYYRCPNCHFLQTEQPYWLEEAYASPMNLTDTGVISRNLIFSKLIAVLIFMLLDPKAKYLDYSGGYGIFTRMMRDIGFDFYWNDPYTQNLVARGFEYDKKMGKVEMLTLFEVFEHFVDPIDEVKKMLEHSDTIVFSTQIVPEPTPKPTEWWYYGLEHGQHTALYSVKTLENIAEQFNMKLYTNGLDLHMLTKKPLVPKAIERKQLIRWNTVLSGKLAGYYRAEPRQLPKRSVREVAKQAFNAIRFGKHYLLKDNLSEVEIKELSNLLNEKGLLQEYFLHMHAKHLGLFTKFVEKGIASKTFDDMLYMKQFMHQ